MTKREATAQEGFTATWTGLPTQQLAAHLQAFLAQPDVVGLVEGLAAALWLHGESDGTALVYRLSPTALPGQTAITGESVAASELLQRWPSGRLFHAGVEWRWQQKSADNYQLLGLTEDVAPLQLTASSQTEQEPSVALPSPICRSGWCVSKSHQQLVGSTIVKHSQATGASAWQEVRNPRPLIYPLDHENHANRQPRLEVRRYANDWHIVHFIRYCKVSYEPTT